MCICLHVVHGCSGAAKAELSGRDRHSLACKPQTIYYLPRFRKCLLTPESIENFFLWRKRTRRIYKKKKHKSLQTLSKMTLLQQYLPYYFLGIYVFWRFKKWQTPLADHHICCFWDLGSWTSFLGFLWREASYTPEFWANRCE